MTASAIHVGIAGRNNRSTGSVVRVNARNKQSHLLASSPALLIRFIIGIITRPTLITSQIPTIARLLRQQYQLLIFVAVLPCRGINLTHSEVCRLQQYRDQANRLAALATARSIY